MATVDLQLQDIHKGFGAFKALDGVALEVAAGELVCLQGPSGCGKTTLLRCIAGLERQDQGRILLAGRDVSSLPSQARDYGILFQSYALFPNLTVADQVKHLGDPCTAGLASTTCHTVGDAAAARRAHAGARCAGT